MTPQTPRAFRIASGGLAPIVLDVNWQRIPTRLLALVRSNVTCFFIFDDGREVEVTSLLSNVDWVTVERYAKDHETIPVSLIVPEFGDIIEGVGRWQRS